MTSEARGSLKISGSGSAGGGRYEEVKISGSGRVTGDVEAETIKISGSGKMDGNVQAREFKASGSFTVTGDLSAGQFKCSGSGKIGGAARADSFRTSGSVSVGGKLTGGEAEVSGSAKVANDVEMEQFRSRGAFAIDGLLSADSIEIALGGDSRAREVGGECVRVMSRASASRAGGWLGGRSASLSAETIEGDDVYLEATQANIVRGRRVTIGPGCHIKAVEFGESLQIDPDATAGGHTYTGDGSPPPVRTDPAERPRGWAAEHVEHLSPGWAMTITGREIRNPVLRGIVALIGIVIAMIVVGGVVFILLPTVGLAVSLILGGVAALLLLLFIGLAPLAFGALLIEAVRWPIARRRRHRPAR